MRLLWVFVPVVLAGCGRSVVTKADQAEADMPLGVVDRSVLAEPQFHEFQARYDTVMPAPEFIQMISQLHHDVDVLVFFGTWCGDSKREVPRFLKIADETGIGNDRITLYGVNRSKKSADGLTDAFQIELVPTFIFRRDGKEIGRITEHPETTLEEDMVHILLSDEVTH